MLIDRPAKSQLLFPSDLKPRCKISMKKLIWPERNFFSRKQQKRCWWKKVLIFFVEAQFANFQLWERFCAISTIQAWPSDRSYLQNSVTDWKKSLKAKRRSSFSFSEVSTFSPCTVSSAKQQPIEINSLSIRPVLAKNSPQAGMQLAPGTLRAFFAPTCALWTETARTQEASKAHRGWYYHTGAGWIQMM